MLLKFRIETRKIKQPRIVVLRLFTDKDGKITEKSLGSFNSKRSYDHITAQLTESEQYEFDNFIKTIEFAKNAFNTEVDKVDRFIIKAAPRFKEKLYAIWQESRKWGIEFIPEYEMLSLAFEKASIIEEQLAVLTAGIFKPTLNISADGLFSVKHGISKLFSVAIEAAGSAEKLADIFNDIAAKKYGKSPKFKAHHFDFLLVEENDFPKWYYSVAIDALLLLDIQPDHIISPALMTEHWLRLNEKNTLKNTQSHFNKTFPDLKNNTTCHNVIIKHFINHEIERMAFGKKYYSPGKAFQYWFKSNFKMPILPPVEKIINQFNAEFPLLANNPFFINLITLNCDIK